MCVRWEHLDLVRRVVELYQVLNYIKYNNQYNIIYIIDEIDINNKKI